MDIVELAPGDERLGAVFGVMRQLRTELTEERFRSLYESGHPRGYRIAGVFDDGECRAAAGFRVMVNFVSGRHVYVDDLVTGEQWRSHGYGRLLDEYLVDLARNEGCTSVQLDSNVRRAEAHRFYFRERYSIAAFHFVKAIT